MPATRYSHQGGSARSSVRGVAAANEDIRPSRVDGGRAARRGRDARGSPPRAVPAARRGIRGRAAKPFLERAIRSGRARRGHRYGIALTIPPSTWIAAPVTYDAAG